MSRLRLAADGPLILLAALGLAFVAGLVAFVARHSMPYDPFVACQTVATTVAARLTALGTLLPLAVVAVVLLAAALAAAHQLWVTRRVLAGVLAGRVEPDERLRRLADAAGIGRRLDVVDDRGVYTFCYGLIRPRVCVTTALAGMLADDELLAVLRHEAHHLGHHDPLKILASRALASGLFFLPLAGALRNGFLAGKEICADASAARSGSDGALARALYRMLGAERPTWPAGVLAVGALTPTEARIRHLVEPEAAGATWPRPADWIVSLALMAGIFGFSHGTAVASRSEPIHASCTPVALLGPAPMSVHPPVGAAP